MSDRRQYVPRRSLGRRYTDRKMPRHLRDLWMVLLTIILLLALRAQQESNQRQHAEDRRILALVEQVGTAHTELVQACNRLQIQRIEDNISHFADWKVYKVVLALQQEMPVTRDRQRFLAPLRESVAEKSWTPRTDCGLAVALGGVRYRPPRPIPFSQRLPPPDALTLLPSDFG